MPGTGTLIYSPDIRVYVYSRDSGSIYDLSDDIQDFELSRQVSAVSSFSCSLNNKYKKYDRRLRRMDRIVVWLRRVQWLQCFAGYLDSVPYETVVPGAVNISASCTLKRLQYTYWDAHTAEAQQLLPGVGNVTSGHFEDGGAGQGMFNLLTKVVHWNPSNIHIQKIPQEFLLFADQLDQENSDLVDPVAVANLNKLLDANGYSGGSAAQGSSTSGAGGPTPNPAPGNPAYPLPATRGKCSSFGGPDDPGAWANFALTGESGKNPKDFWYCAMRWQPKSDANAYAYWKDQKLLVTAVDKPQNKCVVRAADWGPSGSYSDNPRFGDTGRVIDLGPDAWKHLDIGNGEVTITLVDKSTPVGPVSGAPGAPGPAQNGSSASAGPLNADVKLNIQPGSGADMSNLHPGTWAMGYWVAQIAKNNGLEYAISSAFRAGSITNSGHASNHSVGLALDIVGPTPDDTATMQKLYDLFVPYAQKGAFREMIWQHTIWNASGVSSYYAPTDHFNHVHLATADPDAFLGNQVNVQGAAATLTAAGPGGDSTPGQITEVDSDGIVMGSATSPFTVIFRGVDIDPAMSGNLTGRKAFINDESVLNTFSYLAGASLREYQSGPNGDFIAWFPDWFGIWSRNVTMEIRDIELVGFSLQVSDQPLATHVAVTGNTQEQSGGITLADLIRSRGIVSVEQDKVMKLLLGIDPTSQKKAIDSLKFLNTFGMRPKREDLPQIRSHRWEFMRALFTFMKQWSMQYQSPVNLTFMPELYPGMRISLPDHNFEVYVESVSHRGSRASGFGTSVVVSCPTRNGHLLEFDVEFTVDTGAPTNDPAEASSGEVDDTWHPKGMM